MHCFSHGRIRAAVIGALLVAVSASAQTPAPRAKVGVALGGGSARGLAHVGVLRWLEEHHIPIDELAGTSMGGLIGGSYATGMTPDEIETMLDQIDWDAMFGSSRFDPANVRRKRDLRAYPSRLEFGVKGGLVPPPSLNNGQQVDLLLSRIASSYYDLRTFDDLPTPFRCVALDLTRSKPVVLADGSLARAMRATMSLPLIFPPVQIADQVLVDGGAMNNIPADVVRAMGADHVIAVNVGDVGDKSKINYSLLGLVMETLDSMMRANTLRGVMGADVMITVPLAEYGSLDWRKAKALIGEGYQAAETMRAQLLPFAVSDADWQQWRDARAAKRRTSLPSPAFVEVEGAAPADALRMQRVLAAHVGKPLDTAALDLSLYELSGLDRYEALSWALVDRNGDYGLRITARPKSYGPPFIFLGVSLENTTGNEFRFGLAGRYLAFDVLGSGTELRLDAAVGSDPSVGAAWSRPVWTKGFIEPNAGVSTETLNFIQDGRTVAAYERVRTRAGFDGGINLGRLDEIRAGFRYGWTTATIQIGNPGLPEVKGEDSSLRLGWTHDGQDDPVVPSRGAHVESMLQKYLSAPDVAVETTDGRKTEDVTQLAGSGSWLVSFDRDKKRRAFVIGGAGTSFGGRPLPTEQFGLGGPFHMSAFSVGERRGDHYAFAGGGYLHQVMRLPDFLGGPVFAAGWMETGTAFNSDEPADVDLHTSAGVIADTLIGPVFGGLSFGIDGGSRFYFGIGRIFR
jgi:NTE family protein